MLKVLVRHGGQPGTNSVPGESHSLVIVHEDGTVSVPALRAIRLAPKLFGNRFAARSAQATGSQRLTLDLGGQRSLGSVGSTAPNGNGGNHIPPASDAPAAMPPICYTPGATTSRPMRAWPLPKEGRSELGSFFSPRQCGSWISRTASKSGGNPRCPSNMRKLRSLLMPKPTPTFRNSKHLSPAQRANTGVTN